MKNNCNNPLIVHTGPFICTLRGSTGPSCRGQCRSLLPLTTDHFIFQCQSLSYCRRPPAALFLPAVVCFAGPSGSLCLVFFVCTAPFVCTVQKLQLNNNKELQCFPGSVGRSCVTVLHPAVSTRQLTSVSPAGAAASSSGNGRRTRPGTNDAPPAAPSVRPLRLWFPPKINNGPFE